MTESKHFQNVHAAFAAGYTVTGDMALQRGYVSRKKDPLDGPVYAAGGSRKGQLFFLVPNRKSSQFCYRQYLIAPTE